MTMNSTSLESPYHKSCYKEQCRQKCDVYGFIFWANPACPVVISSHDCGYHWPGLGSPSQPAQPKGPDGTGP